MWKRQKDESSKKAGEVSQKTHINCKLWNQTFIAHDNDASNMRSSVCEAVLSLTQAHLSNSQLAINKT